MFSFDRIHNYFNNFISGGVNTINKLGLYFYEKIEGNIIGINSLYLFIKIIIETKHIIKNELYEDDTSINNLKDKVFNCGCIGIKFTQWIISKLKGLNDKDKYQKIIHAFEDVFDNCGNHDIKYTKKIFKRFWKRFRNYF